MGNTPLYLLTVLIWGSSFYAIKHQLTTVSPEVSIFYRFSIAALLLFCYCVLRKKAMKFPVTTHVRFLFMGLLLFNLNFLFVYIAAEHMTTGLVSVVFSLIVIFNMVNGALFLGDRITPMMLAGAGTGFFGIALVFYPEVSGFNLDDSGLTSLMFALMGTVSASFGMITSASIQRLHVPVMSSNAWGMFYGAGLMLVSIWLQGIPLTFDSSPGYVISLLFLAMFASVLAFGCFLTLIGRIGAGKASYATVLFPILALALSTIFEDYSWTLVALTGVALALAGNGMILLDRQR